jgi:hypothetical protein
MLVEHLFLSFPRTLFNILLFHTFSFLLLPILLLSLFLELHTLSAADIFVDYSAVL